MCPAVTNMGTTLVRIMNPLPEVRKCSPLKKVSTNTVANEMGSGCSGYMKALCGEWRIYGASVLALRVKWNVRGLARSLAFIVSCKLTQCRPEANEPLGLDFGCFLFEGRGEF